MSEFNYKYSNPPAKANYIIDQVPATDVDEFLLFMQEYRKKTGCRFRFKADGRTTQVVTEFPATY